MELKMTQLYSLPEVARYLHLKNIRSVQKKISGGELTGRKIGRRILILGADLLRYVESPARLHRSRAANNSAGGKFINLPSSPNR